MFPAPFTEAGPVLTTPTSATGFTVVGVLLLLLPGLVSVTPAGTATVPVLMSAAALAGAVPVMVMTTLPPGGSVGIVPLTLLPTTVTEPGHRAPPSGLPQFAPTPVMPAGTASLREA